jgi:hypothetical protein
MRLRLDVQGSTTSVDKQQEDKDPFRSSWKYHVYVPIVGLDAVRSTNRGGVKGGVRMASPHREFKRKILR